MKQWIILLGGMFLAMLSAQANCDLSPKFGYATKSMTVKFTDKSKGEITSYLWAFGDGQTSTNQHPEHIYEKGGMYLFSLTIANEEGCSETFEGKVYIFDVNKPVPSADEPAEEEEVKPAEETEELIVTADDASIEQTLEEEEAIALADKAETDVYPIPYAATKTVSAVRNFPNPFNISTTISFEVKAAARIQVDVYSVDGRLVNRLADEIMDSGQRQIPFERGNLQNGTYLVTISTDTQTVTQKMLIQ